MRLFIAIDVSDAVRERAVDARRRLAGQHAVLARGLRWVRAEHLHLTLRFIGEVPAPMAAHVVAACRDPLAIPPFDIRFGGLAWLPPGGAPRVLMLPVAEGLDALRELKAAVEGRLPAGVPPDDARPFLPHLTLARVRDDARREARALARDWSAPSTAVASPVTGVTLFESRLSPQGPEYRALARLALAGPAGVPA